MNRDINLGIAISLISQIGRVIEMAKNYLLWTHLLKVSEDQLAWWQERYNADPSVSNEMGLKCAYARLMLCKKNLGLVK